MKKLLITFSLIFIHFSSAQKKFELGFNIGYVNSTVQYTVFGTKVPTNSKSSLYVSAPMTYHLNKNISFFGGLGMAGLGAEGFVMENGEVSRLHLTTVYIPVGIKIFPVEKFALLGGFNLGFTTKALGNGQSVEFTNFKSSNNSFLIGGEYHIGKSYLAEVRYNIGITNIINNPNEEMKNSFLQIGVGYKFAN